MFMVINCKGILEIFIASPDSRLFLSISVTLHSNTILYSICSFICRNRIMRAIVTHIEYSSSRDVTFIRCKPEESFSFKE
jgi:hypothetical protein